MKSPVMKIVGMVCWVITGIYSLNALTSLLGYDYMGMILMREPSAIRPIMLVIGLAGLISLIMFVMMVTCGCGSCGTSKCKCK